VASRDAWVATAKALVGLEPSDPQYQQRLYLDAIDGEPTPLQRQQAREMAATQYGCGLTWESVARSVGATYPHLRRWYGEPSRIGGVIRDMVGAARGSGAWVTPGSDRLPQPGDAVLIGGPAGWSRGKQTTEHVLIVTDRQGPALHSVDGGQPGIAERARVLVETPQGELWLADSGASIGADGRPDSGRRVQGWVDADKVPTRESGEAPPGPPFRGGGGQSGGGGSSAGWGSASGGGGGCPPCATPWDLLLLAFLIGNLSGQKTREPRRSIRRRLSPQAIPTTYRTTYPDNPPSVAGTWASQWQPG